MGSPLFRAMGPFPRGVNEKSQFLVLIANPFVETRSKQNYDPFGGFNAGSQFLLFVANPLVETPHKQNYDPSRKLHFSL